MVARSLPLLRYLPPMIRFLVNFAVYMAAAAIGLLVADILLDDLSINYPVGFLIAAVLFGLIQALIEPLMENITQKNAQMLTGGVGLFSALIALFITATISDNISVDGVSGWFLSALIIWLASMFAGFILKVTVAKRFIQQVRD
jgi:uncharacterized membrane protein YvlD (DUF360 family)